MQKNKFLLDLILQRTGPFLKLGGRNVLNDYMRGGADALVNFLTANNLQQKYLRMVFADLKAELNQIKKYIPTGSFKKVVSIGSGNGILELLLVQEGQTQELLLVDIEDTPELYHGFNINGSGYANLIDSSNFIKSNTEFSSKVYVCNPTKEKLPEFKFSLLLSTLSMGFHYPCDEYVEFVTEQSLFNSFVVLDKRRDAPDAGFVQILKKFSVIYFIKNKKHDRFFLKRN